MFHHYGGHVTKGRRGQYMGCVSLESIYTHHASLFPVQIKIQPISTAGKTIPFLSHTGVLEEKHLLARKRRAPSWAQVSWTGSGCAYFTASTRQRGGDVAGWVASTLCCSSQWTVGSASSKQCGEMSRCPHVVAAWAVKLREWALWLAGSSFPFMDNKCRHKIKTVTKQRLHKSGQSLRVSEGYTSCTS